MENSAQILEHLALYSPLTLQDFCKQLQTILALPDFTFDRENETEWGVAASELIEYTVSRPYEPGTLQTWDNTVPAICNFGISVSVPTKHPSYTNSRERYQDLITPIATAITEGFSTSVYYHRTWLKAGKNVKHQHVFKPLPRSTLLGSSSN